LLFTKRAEENSIKRWRVYLVKLERVDVHNNIISLGEQWTLDNHICKNIGANEGNKILIKSTSL
jgi:hypothetical protein